jgi:apolipoprotein N-acyltransferase
MRQFTKNDAEFLANITNDTWYGDTPMPHHHFALAVFRAVENRKFVVRAANSGFSGIVAPDGRILKKSQLFIETIIVHSIHPNNIKTIYSRFGDWFVYLNFAIVILLVFVLSIKKRLEH